MRIFKLFFPGFAACISSLRQTLEGQVLTCKKHSRTLFYFEVQTQFQTKVKASQISYYKNSSHQPHYKPHAIVLIFTGCKCDTFSPQPSALQCKKMRHVEVRLAQLFWVKSLNFQMPGIWFHRYLFVYRWMCAGHSMDICRSCNQTERQDIAATVLRK